MGGGGGEGGVEVFGVEAELVGHGGELGREGGVEGGGCFEEGWGGVVVGVGVGVGRLGCGGGGCGGVGRGVGGEEG